MSCNLCDYRTLVNEAQERGDETWVDDTQVSGLHVFVIPKGEKPDVRLHRDGTFGPQRKVWFCGFSDSCTCGERVKLKLPPSTWEPDAAALEPEPEPPRVLREQGEVAQTLNLL